jgi:hypothetical protein
MKDGLHLAQTTPTTLCRKRPFVEGFTEPDLGAPWAKVSKVRSADLDLRFQSLFGARARRTAAVSPKGRLLRRAEF